ncbi:hypothetical protein GCM10027290_08160 [Micromonospora sonneratiae]
MEFGGFHVADLSGRFALGVTDFPLPDPDLADLAGGMSGSISLVSGAADECPDTAPTIGRQTV